MTIDESISHALEVAEQEECFINYPHSDIVLGDLDIESRKHYAAEQRQLAEWLKELKNLQEENKVLISECDRLIKEKGELLKKLEPITEYKRLLKIAVEDMGVTVAKVYNGGLICECCKWKSQMGECCCPDDRGCDVAYRWRHADEVLALIGEDGENDA